MVKKQQKKWLIFLALFFLWGLLFFSASIQFFGAKQFESHVAQVQTARITQVQARLLEQEGKILTFLLANDASAENLQQMLQDFAQIEFVQQVKLYNATGNLLGQAGQASDLSSRKEILPLYEQKQMEGFLEIDWQSMQAHEQAQSLKPYFMHLYAQAMIFMLMGALLAGSFYLFFKLCRPKASSPSAMPQAEKPAKPYIKKAKKNKKL